MPLGRPVTAAQPVTLKGEKGVCWSQTKMLIKVKMSFANTFENQDRFIEAFIQENRHPVPESVKIIFDKNSNVLLHSSLSPAAIKPNFKSQINPSFSLSLSPHLYSPSLLPLTLSPSSLPPGWQGGRARSCTGRKGEEKSVLDGKASLAEPD